MSKPQVWAIQSLTNNFVNIGLERGLDLGKVGICNYVEVKVAWEPDY